MLLITSHCAATVSILCLHLKQEAWCQRSPFVACCHLDNDRQITKSHRLESSTIYLCAQPARMCDLRRRRGPASQLCSSAFSRTPQELSQRNVQLSACTLIYITLCFPVSAQMLLPFLLLFICIIIIPCAKKIEPVQRSSIDTRAPPNQFQIVALLILPRRNCFRVGRWCREVRLPNLVVVVVFVVDSYISRGARQIDEYASAAAAQGRSCGTEAHHCTRWRTQTFRTLLFGASPRGTQRSIGWSGRKKGQDKSLEKLSTRTADCLYIPCCWSTLGVTSSNGERRKKWRIHE